MQHRYWWRKAPLRLLQRYPLQLLSALTMLFAIMAIMATSAAGLAMVVPRSEPHTVSLLSALAADYTPWPDTAARQAPLRLEIIDEVARDDIARQRPPAVASHPLVPVDLPPLAQTQVTPVPIARPQQTQVLAMAPTKAATAAVDSSPPQPSPAPQIMVVPTVSPTEPPVPTAATQLPASEPTVMPIPLTAPTLPASRSAATATPSRRYPTARPVLATATELMQPTGTPVPVAPTGLPPTALPPTVMPAPAPSPTAGSLLEPEHPISDAPTLTVPPTPTPTATATPIRRSTPTRTATPTVTPTLNPTPTSMPTPTPTATATATPTATPTAMPTVTATPMATMMPTVTTTATVMPTPTQTHVLSITPILECVERNLDGSLTGYFGYDNPNLFAVTIPIGKNNLFTGAPDDQGQPTVFDPGRNTMIFSVVFDGAIAWKLDGSTTSASNASAACTPAATP